MKKIYSILLSLIIILGTVPQINAINIETNDNKNLQQERLSLGYCGRRI